MKVRSLATSLAFVLAAALAATSAQAQVRPGMGGHRPQPPERAIRLYALGGWMQPDLEELNARLAGLPEPYSAVSKDIVLFGGGLHGRVNRFMLGVEAALMQSIDDAEMGDQRKATLSGMTGSFMAGFSLLRTQGFDFYPLIQLGGAAASLEVQERSDPTWDDALANPGRATTLGTWMFHGAAGIGMEYTFRSGFFMGVRGTWGFTPPTDGWSDEKGEVLGGPEMDLSGPSVRLLLGLGGR